MPITPKTGALFHAETHWVALAGSLASIESIAPAIRLERMEGFHGGFLE